MTPVNTQENKKRVRHEHVAWTTSASQTCSLKWSRSWNCSNIEIIESLKKYYLLCAMDTGPPAAWQGPDLLQQVDINRNLSWSFYRNPEIVCVWLSIFPEPEMKIPFLNISKLKKVGGFGIDIQPLFRSYKNSIAYSGIIQIRISHPPATGSWRRFDQIYTFVTYSQFLLQA